MIFLKKIVGSTQNHHETKASIDMSQWVALSELMRSMTSDNSSK